MSLLKKSMIGLVAALGMLLIQPALADDIADYSQVVADFRASDVLVYDRAGVLLDRVRTDFQGRRGDWLDLDDISPALQQAVIRSEDQRFYDHSGVDWQAVASAAWGNIAGQQHRGASTISMQLAGLLDDELRRPSSGRSIAQKIDQAWQARAIESNWTKAQILEAYLNLAAFRGELIGIDAVSRVLFQKHASGLDAREAALTAVLLRGPNAGKTVLVRRACELLTDLGRPEQCRGLSDFTYRVLQRTAASWVDHRSLAPHYSRQVLRQVPRADRLVAKPITTTLDAALQQFVLRSMGGRLRELRRANVRDAAVVVLDNVSGQVLAYVGSSGDASSATHVDHALSLRQAGSTLKPFLYALAIGQRRVTAASLLDDSPLNLATGNGLYIPQNYDQQFSGWASVRTALASSLNIPAVRVLTMVRPDVFADVLRRLGLPLDQSGDFYGYSLALGSADVTLLTLTNAYRALANGGNYSDVHYLNQAAPAEVRVLDDGAAWIVGDVLSDRQSRAATFGLDSPLSTPFWSAVKTGTSKDMRDNWCIGWSQRYTVGVWVGNSGGASMHDVSGVSGAGPIWHDVISWLHRGQSSQQPSRPSSVTPSLVSFEDGIEPTRHEVFLGDTAVSTVRLAHNLVPASSGKPGISAPAHGTVFALDPDIPPEKQRVLLVATNLVGQGSASVLWQINQQIVGQGTRVEWSPWPGRHTIQLVDSAHRILHQITIEVRGAQAK